RRDLDEEVDAVRTGGVDQRVLRQDLEAAARVRPSKGPLKCQGVALGFLEGNHVGAASADRLHDLVEADVDAAVLDIELKDLELKRSGRSRLRSSRLYVQAERQCREQPKRRNGAPPRPEPSREGNTHPGMVPRGGPPP